MIEQARPFFLIFALFGWGNGGWGGGFGGGGGAQQGYATQADIQRGFDTSAIIGKLDGISQGICDGFYAVNTSLLNGFNGVDNAICSLGYNVQQGFNATQLAMMQGNNALQAQLAQCCCDQRAGLADLKYDMATSAPLSQPAASAPGPGTPRWYPPAPRAGRLNFWATPALARPTT